MADQRLAACLGVPRVANLDANEGRRAEFEFDAPADGEYYRWAECNRLNRMGR